MNYGYYLITEMPAGFTRSAFYSVTDHCLFWDSAKQFPNSFGFEVHMYKCVASFQRRYNNAWDTNQFSLLLVKHIHRKIFWSAVTERNFTYLYQFLFDKSFVVPISVDVFNHPAFVNSLTHRGYSPCERLHLPAANTCFTILQYSDESLPCLFYDKIIVRTCIVS